MAANTQTGSLSPVTPQAVEPTQTIDTLPEELIGHIVSLLSFSDFSNVRLASRTLRQRSLRTFAHRYFRTVNFGGSPLQDTATQERLRGDDFCDAARCFCLTIRWNVAIPNFAPTLGRLRQLESFRIKDGRLWSLDQQWDVGSQLCTALRASQARLTSLHIEGCNVDPDFLSTLLIELSQSLKSLHLTGVKLENSNIGEFLACLQSMSLTELSFCNVGLAVSNLPGPVYGFEPMYRLPCTASGWSFKASASFRDPQKSGKIQYYRILGSLTCATGGVAVKKAIEKMIEMRGQ